MKRLFLMFAALFAVFTAIATAAPGRTTIPDNNPADGFYFGRIAFEDDVIGIAVKARHVQVLVTDAEPGGDAEWFEGAIKGLNIDLRSTSGRARLRATFDPALNICNGTIEMPNGMTRAVATDLAGEGADIYDVKVRNGNYTGRSTQGHRLEAHQEGMFVIGNVTERGGLKLPFKVMDLSQAYSYSVQGGQSDQYTVIISRNATLHYGRGGAVKGGKPNQNLIALDIQPSDNPTPGFFFGKVAFERDVIGIKVNPPDSQGNRFIRAYMSDSEPEPEGDLQWFSGQVSGNNVDLISVTGDGRIQATLTDDLIAGTLTLPGGRMRRFFALPAGDGAGIYDVTVFADGSFFGMSEEGGTLSGQQDGQFVILIITAPNGQVFESHPNDLTRAFGYSILGNQPDTYVAIVAPRGRFVFGRSGLVRTGGAGLNIIGLDKAC